LKIGMKTDWEKFEYFSFIWMFHSLQ